MTDKHSFHEGELAVQKWANQVDIARTASRMITTGIPEAALQFIEQQVMVVIGSLDSDGQIWCSILFGKPGFVRAKDTTALNFDMSNVALSNDDPLWSNIATNRNVGILFIELISRRRLRVNGYIDNKSQNNWVLTVEQAYPNCPKYIQRRDIKKLRKLTSMHTKPTLTGTQLTTDQKVLIRQADTFFVASAYADKNHHYCVDASHRGGHPGFINFTSNQNLHIPDYRGNSMFNTLGNFQSYPQAGLIFIDFYQHRLLQLSGIPIIIIKSDGPDKELAGTQCDWQFETKYWRESTIPFDIDWELLDASPFNPDI